MPNAWTSKDERQYEHIKQSELEEGRGLKRAKQIAAATVNKHRTAEGVTKPAARATKRSQTKHAHRDAPSHGRRAEGSPELERAGEEDQG